jgi:hypothetical protein
MYKAVVVIMSDKRVLLIKKHRKEFSLCVESDYSQLDAAMKSLFALTGGTVECQFYAPHHINGDVAVYLSRIADETLGLICKNINDNFARSIIRGICIDEIAATVSLDALKTGIQSIDTDTGAERRSSEIIAKAMNI